MNAVDFEALARQIENAPEESGPTVDEEGRGVWRIKGAEAIRSLARKGLLERVDSLGHPLGESLAAIAKGPIWAALAGSRGQALLVAELARNLDQPGRINQGWKGTCAATCAEVYMARKDPAEYARLVAGLVSLEGRVSLRSGEALVCDEDVLAPSRGEHGRNVISRVFQVACMELADGDLDYDNASDGHYEGERNVGTGLEMGPFEGLLCALTGKAWRTISTRHTAMARMLAKLGVDTASAADLERDALSIIEQSTKKGESVFATLDLPVVTNPAGRSERIEHAAHKITVLGVDWDAEEVHYEDPMDPREPWFEGATVRIHDTFGHCSMSIADFKRLLSELSYRPELWERSA